MNTETFKNAFKTMCQDKFYEGATLMDVFMTLNDANLTLKQVEEQLSVLYDQGFCKLLNGNNQQKRFLYQEPTNFVTNTSSVPGEDFFNQFLQTFQKSQAEMMSVQKEILSALQDNNASVNQMKDMLPFKEEGPQAIQSSVPNEQKVSVKVKSFKGDEFYDVNMVDKTCTCPNYKFVQGELNPPGQCKHLKAALDNNPAIQAALLK